MKKIMFNDRFWLTQAVLERRKRQTRGFVPKEVFSLIWDVEETFESPKVIYVEDEYGDFIDIRNTRFAQYKKGEVVAIAQRYSDIYAGLLSDYETYSRNLPRGMSAEEFRREFEQEKGWNNKMFVKAKYMPHRITITDVRTQTIQEITDDEVLLEGVREVETSNNWGNSATHPEYSVTYYDKKGSTKQLIGRSHKEAYAALIDALSGKGTWEGNPYVFAYDFDLVK